MAATIQNIEHFRILAQLAGCFHRGNDMNIDPHTEGLLVRHGYIEATPNGGLELTPDGALYFQSLVMSDVLTVAEMIKEREALS